MKFSELNQRAQRKAVKDYFEGWKETHEADDLTIREAREILLHDEEMQYDSEGNYQDTLELALDNVERIMDR